jgi:DNA repair protein RadC
MMILREAILRYGPGKRVPGARRVRESQDAADVCRDLRLETQEHFCVLLLSSKAMILARATVAIGSLTEVQVHPREVFRTAIHAGAAAVILVHNHPSGDPTPSSADDQITARLRKAGTLVGVPVLDHVIMGSERHYSYRDQPGWEVTLEEI